jgi:hypothetical protein
MSKESIEKLIKIEAEKLAADMIGDGKTIKIEGGNGVALAAVGMNVIVRSRNEGINAGTVEAADETGIILKNARRLWYHKPKENSASWYEGVAMYGISDDSKVSTTVPRKFIIEDYSIVECTNNAFESIMEKSPHAQR